MGYTAVTAWTDNSGLEEWTFDSFDNLQEADTYCKSNLTDDSIIFLSLYETSQEEADEIEDGTWDWTQAEPIKTYIELSLCV